MPLINTTAQTSVGPGLVIPAGVPAAGVTYFYDVYLNNTAVGTPGSVTHALSPYLSVGPTSLVTVTLTNTASTVVGVVGTYRVWGYVSFVSATSCQSSIFVQGGLVLGNASNAVFGTSGYFTQTGLTTTSPNTLNVFLTLGATTGGPSVTPEFATAYRVS
jgi:hypothetical protein